jgi:membrane protease YdiL (CAAX protease family)
MTGLSKGVKWIGEYREVVFWLLLLGSWQFLVSPGTKNAALGVGGTAAFLLLAYHNLGRLRRLGLGYANWDLPKRIGWWFPLGVGLVAGVVIFGIGSANGQNMMLGRDRRLALLQVTLGPVLEEVVFRGYLYSLLIWVCGKVARGPVLNWLVIATAAIAFALVHFAQPGVSWLQLVCIASTGCLYGWIRCWSASTAPAALSHAAYNLTLHVTASVMGRASV